MKKRSGMRLIFSVIPILIAGCMHQGDIQIKVPTQEANVFRETLWQERQLDLLVQAGLIIAGALGVAALLPSEEED